MAPLVVEQVTKNFRQGDRDVRALSGVSLTVARGMFLAIMGASGSGKSTLLHLMAGLAKADGGRILVEGQDLAQLTDYKLTLFRRHHIGLVFQSFNLIPTLSAEENILLPLFLERRNGRELREKIEPVLESLGIAHRRRHRPDGMSGGEQQRVAIGRALITDPAVILADEPTGNLDSANSKDVCCLLRDLSINQKRTVVMVTHEPAVAMYAQAVAILKDGKLVDEFAIDPSDPASVAQRYQACLR